ncbi:MAG: AMP-binding protein [Anaerolineae bacterium]|nr:AMP-binding protein [Anaerolineae bacterium]
MKFFAIYRLLQTQAEQQPNNIAIAAPHRPPLTYNQLFDHVDATVNQLNRLGIGRNDKVGIALPNGPEMAVAFLAIASAATSAPLNPAYRAPEYDFYLSDLEAKALVILAGMDSAAIEVAKARHIPIIELTPQADAAGLFSLSGEAQPLTAEVGPSQAGEVALVLHTSGTTSRPKIVPLRHSNICTSAHNIGQTLQLTPEDRCLNVMPLFHIHGLMAATLSTLAAGASVVCTPGFYAPSFFEWMAELRPTWYTAVPTMHQAILARAADNQTIIAESPLRFIRSSSSSLPPQVMKALEDTFQAPVIESYGMTEASHQMASNPLPPLARKPGSVGLAAGPEVGIMHETKARLLPQGQTGEVVIRGANVTLGYANNPEANQKAFPGGGWFRTGDQGYLDDEGYLYVTGRLKEIINRGGEKISPHEVDEVLLDHPDIIQVLTFAVPDEKLGEAVAAAVIVRDGASVNGLDIRRFAAEHLTHFKVPEQVFILDEIPKGPTGKLQRIGLAEKLGLTANKAEPTVAEVEMTAPNSDLERRLADIWAEVLGLEQIGIEQRFLALGGDSVLAVRLVNRIRQSLEIELSLIDFFEAPTIAEQAIIVENLLLEDIERLEG